MNRMTHIISSLGSFLMIPTALLLMSGCRHKDIIEDIGQDGFPIVKVEYNWDETEFFRPDGLANLFYSSESYAKSYWRFDFRPSGGTMRLPKGEYDIVVFNNDTENILFSEINNLDDLTFSTSEIDTSEIPEDQLPFPPQRIYAQPDKMWATILKNIVIEESAEPQTVFLSPKRITRDYNVEMTGIENLESALRYYAVISDLTHIFKASTLEQTGVLASIGNFMQPIDDTSISTTITNFGINKESTHQKLAVYMWLADGSRKVYLYDVTDQIRQAPDSMNLMIRVKGPSLPEITPGEGGTGGEGGMDVGVDNWDFIDIEL